MADSPPSSGTDPQRTLLHADVQALAAVVRLGFLYLPNRDVARCNAHRHLSTTMRYVHHQPRHEAAERLGRHFTGAASELDALLGEPGDLQIGPPD